MLYEVITGFHNAYGDYALYYVAPGNYAVNPYKEDYDCGDFANVESIY